MTGSEIVKRAQSLKNVKYWYGAKGETATLSLARQLAAQYPSIWTPNYYSKAIRACNTKSIVGDCSYLVCYAYDVPQIGSAQIRGKYPVYNTSPKMGRNGMILWRAGHVGIFWDGRVITLRGIDYNYNIATLDAEKFTYVLCDMSVDYGK